MGEIYLHRTKTSYAKVIDRIHTFGNKNFVVYLGSEGFEKNTSLVIINYHDSEDELVSVTLYLLLRLLH